MGICDTTKAQNIEKPIIQQKTQFTLKPIPDKNKNISLGVALEEEMIKKFNAFDILWYAPDDSEILENWIAFTNVDVLRSSDFNIFMQLSVKSRYYNLIIISTGPFAEEIMSLMPQHLLIKNIIIYSKDFEYYKKWSENYESIAQVSTNPTQIFEYLLKLQDSAYNMPLFNYTINYTREFNINYYDPSDKIWKSNNQDNFSLHLNDYEKFTLKTLNDYRLIFNDYGEMFNDFMINSKVIFNLFYADFYPIIFGGEIGLGKVFNHNLMILSLLSLYFSKLPFLFGLLNYSEIENILNEKLELDDLVSQYRKLPSLLNILEEKIEKQKVSILDEIYELQFLQIFLIRYIKFLTKMIYNFDEFSKYPIMIKSLQDLDFCLKYFFFRTYSLFKDPIYKMRCCGSLDNFDKRIYIFYTYSSFKHHTKIALKHVSQENFKIMNQTLIIKDFIIIGNEKFHSEIKSFENNIIHEKILYLSTITQVRNNLVNYTSKKIKYRNFSYIVIIDDKDIEKYLKELFLIMHEFSLVIIVIIYIKDLNILINKNILMNSKNIPIYFACNIIEIKNFIISQKYCNCGKNFIDISLKMRQKVDVILKNYSPRKINIFSSKVLIFDKLSSEDGWELVDLIPKEMFENKYLEISGRISVNTISLNLLELFKENQVESLFYERYCPYFNFCLLPEINSSKYLSIVLKQICYAYSLDEGQKSFYYFLNRNLRSGDLSIIEKYHILILVFNRGIRRKNDKKL